MNSVGVGSPGGRTEGRESDRSPFFSADSVINSAPPAAHFAGQTPRPWNWPSPFQGTSAKTDFEGTAASAQSGPSTSARCQEQRFVRLRSPVPRRMPCSGWITIGRCDCFIEFEHEDRRTRRCASANRFVGTRAHRQIHLLRGRSRRQSAANGSTRRDGGAS